eukprot:Selendium_serpulae@DN8960_c0_g1_i1.p2
MGKTVVCLMSVRRSRLSVGRYPHSTFNIIKTVAVSNDQSWMSSNMQTMVKTICQSSELSSDYDETVSQLWAWQTHSASETAKQRVTHSKQNAKPIFFLCLLCNAKKQKVRQKVCRAFNTQKG